MRDFLNEMIKQGGICGIYSDINAIGKFSAGYVLAVDEDFYLMESVDPYGKSAGIFCELTEKIMKIESRNTYCADLEKLFRYYKQERLSNFVSQGDLLLDVIDYALANGRVCSIELCESDGKDVIGYIDFLDGENLTVQTLTENGSLDGVSMININDISRISCGSPEEQKTETLYKLTIAKNMS